MAWWRGLLKVVCSILLITALILCIASFSASRLVSYENLKPAFIGVVKQNFPVINETTLTASYQMLMKNCKGESVEFPLGNIGTGNVTLKCAELNASGPQGLVDLVANSIFNEIYYTHYDQDPIKILTQPSEQGKESEKLMVLISEHAHKAFRMYALYLLIIAVILLALIFLLSIPKSGAFISLGTDFIITGLPLFLLKFGAAALPLQGQMAPVAPLVKTFFSYLSTYFLALIIIGAIFLILGIILGVLARKSAIKEETSQKGRKPQKK